MGRRSHTNKQEADYARVPIEDLMGLLNPFLPLFCFVLLIAPWFMYTLEPRQYLPFALIWICFPLENLLLARLSVGRPDQANFMEKARLGLNMPLLLGAYLALGRYQLDFWYLFLIPALGHTAIGTAGYGFRPHTATIACLATYTAAALLSRFPQTMLHQTLFHGCCIVFTMTGTYLLFSNLTRKYAQAHQAESELKLLSQRLENQVRERTAELERASHFKSQFLATMSHEIRTPMNAILGMLQLLNRESLPPDAELRFAVIRENSRHLLTILNEVLDLSSIQEGRLSLEKKTFSPWDSLINIVSLYDSRATEKGVRLNILKTTELPEAVCGDPDRWSQIIRNLVSNAVKFTEKGNVDVLVSSATEEDELISIMVSVKDSGIGMAEKTLDNLFQDFFQGDERIRQRFGGSGLGLAISYRLTEIMGGTLTADSVLGKGSVFTSCIPFALADKEGLEARDKIQNEVLTDLGNRLPCRVLVIEDLEINRMVAQELLQFLGYRPMLAASGKEGLEMLARQPFDLVLLDIEMPVMDGFQVLEIIRNDPQLKGLPVLAFTANVFPHQVKTYLDRGFIGVAPKPLIIDELARAIIKVMAPDGFSMELPKQAQEPDEHQSVTQGLLARYEDKPELVSGLAESFLKSCPKKIEQLETALKAGDLPALRSCTHALKGMMSMLGALEVSRHCQELQHAAEDGQKEVLEENVPLLVLELNTVQEEFDDFLASRS